MNISVSTEIESSKRNVWLAITNISNSVNMISGILDLTILEQPEQGLIGLKWSETRKMFGKEAAETMWITECKQEHYYCTRAENCGAIYTTKLALSEVGNNTLLEMTFSGTSDAFFTRLMTSIMGVLIKNSMIKMLQQDLSDIKSFVEKNN